MPETCEEPGTYRELDYVPLCPWYCTACLSSGYVARSLYRWQTVERAYSAHAVADPECAARPEGHRYVFVEDPEA
jgi:hypothetical protein